MPPLPGVLIQLLNQRNGLFAGRASEKLHIFGAEIAVGIHIPGLGLVCGPRGVLCQVVNAEVVGLLSHVIAVLIGTRTILR